MYYSDGSMAPVYACVRDPAYLQFVHDWIDTVKWLGATTIFWDEPHMPTKTVGDKRYFGCACPNCRRAFEERFNRPMPEVVDDDVEEFQAESIAEYFRDITAYNASQGLINSVCVMLGTFGMSLAAADKICAIPTVDNIGSDPYWVGGETPVYKYVYDGARRNIEMCERFGKDHNIWLQCFGNPRGKEEEIVTAAEAAYESGYQYRPRSRQRICGKQEIIGDRLITDNHIKHHREHYKGNPRKRAGKPVNSIRTVGGVHCQPQHKGRRRHIQRHRHLPDALDKRQPDCSAVTFGDKPRHGNGNNRI
jgi:hypothetical protein